MPFICSICEEESTRICVACTKDSCENHLCEKCGRCSDCCGCEVALNESSAHEPAYGRNGHHPEALPVEPPPPPIEEPPAPPIGDPPAQGDDENPPIEDPEPKPEPQS